MNRYMVLTWVPPLVPLLPTCSWKSLRSKPLAPSYTPSLWLRFVGDTFVINKAEHSHQLLQHINNQDSHIQFTVEEPSQEGTLPFLDHRSQQHFQHYSLQKTYIHRSIPTLGKQPLHYSQT